MVLSGASPGSSSVSYSTSEPDNSMDVDHCETGNRVSLPVGNCEHRDGNTRNYSGLERSSSQQAEAFHDAKDKTCVDSSINPADRLSKRKRSDEDNSDLSTPGIDKTRLSPRVEINQKGKESPLPEHSVKRQKSDVLGTGATKKNFTPLNISATDNRLHRLTVLLWQKIFCFVPPVFLGRLLRVDHAFHDILKSSRSYIAQAPLQSFNALHDQKSESIWIASRKRFAPGLPRPLFGQSELEMWKLIRGNRCQVCGERKSLLTTSMVSSPWRAGPGLVGVRVVWPFGIRCCGPCLLGSSEQEVSLLFSSTFPSFLLAALPCAYITQSQDYVAAASIRNTAVPTDVQMGKYYYKPHIQQIKRRFEEVKLLGPGSAEEWIKGLNSEGKDRNQDSARWEQWETKGGLRKVNIRPNSKIVSSTRQAPITITATTDELPLRTESASAERETRMAGPPDLATTYMSSQNHPSGPFLDPPHSITTLCLGGLPQRPHIQIPQTKYDRNIHNVNEAKAARRAEIERRCLEFDPPIDSTILSHMESFRAALQISTPLTDNAWEVLKPRLLSQREAAEKREYERLEQSRVLQAKSEEWKQEDAQLKEAKESQEQEWDVAQAPVRDRLAKYADEVIRDVWSGGASVTKDNCSKFAADVLVHSRRRFCEDMAQEDFTSHTTSEHVRGDSPGHCPPHTLNLENMKWLFDNKIKGITEQFQKELFLCNGCEGNFKFYGFEAVIQHYAAKHTSSLSRGSVVVHWKASWPEHPPFHPNPSAAKAAYYAIPMPVTSIGPPQYNRPLPISTERGNYGRSLEPSAASPPAIFGASGRPGDLDIQLQQNQYQHSHLMQHFSITKPNYPQAIDYHRQHSLYRPLQSFPATTGNIYAPQPMSGHGPVLGIIPNLSALPPNHPVPASLGRQVPLAGSEQYYQTQMNEMAKHARDVWFGTSGIKNIPQSVRIYVVIKHVVSRFEQKYTNEPSLSMFIDGLDHNALMRPVRSLNGLACKACVASAINANLEFHSHPQHTSDRKLYTLPHLLNHFKSVHVERARPTVGLETGMEASRLDWKRDMIELPETSLIADLIKASGMDDSRLELIAKAFPGVFPEPLPSLSSAINAGPVPKYKPDHMNPLYAQHSYEQPSRAVLVQYQLGTTGLETDGTSPRSHSGLQTRPNSSPRTSEPPGEDEYDPNRPAYLGRMVESYQFGLPRRKSSVHGATKEEELGQGTNFQSYLPHHEARGLQTHTEGVYGSQLLPHHNQMTQEQSDGLRASSQASSKHDWLGVESQKLEQAQTKSARTSFKRIPSPRAEIAAADKFLNELTPAIESIRYMEDNLRKEAEIPIRTSTYDKLGRIPSSSKFDALDNTSPTKDDLTEHSERATPSYTERSGNVNDSHSQVLVHHKQYSDHQRPTPRIRYFYTSGGTSIERALPYDCDQRIPSPSLPPPDIGMEQGNGILRSIGEPATWPRAIHSQNWSVLPVPDSIDHAHYRVRSPHRPVRRDSIYRVRSPHDLTFNNVRPQRSVQYSYSPTHDQFGGKANFTHDIRNQHVEYVIDSENTSSRYIVAHPSDHQIYTEQIRVERNHDSHHIFEKDGALYYAETQPYTTRTRRPLEPQYLEYRDYI